MKILDLFCGAGGCSMGYHYAGFKVTGVDIKEQPNYPFTFVQMDAIDYIMSHNLSQYDVIHASPPCQLFSVQTKAENREGHVDLISPLRTYFQKHQLNYVMENVPQAPLKSPIILCGEMFGLKVIRHRAFESNMSLAQPEHVEHKGTVNDGYYATVVGMGGARRDSHGFMREGSRDTKVWREAMEISWMDRYELTQAIPPAYTEYIGRQIKQSFLLKSLGLV